MGLLRYRAQLLLQEWIAIVGGQSYRDFADASIFARTRDIRKAVIGQRGIPQALLGMDGQRSARLSLKPLPRPVEQGDDSTALERLVPEIEPLSLAMKTPKRR